MSKPIYFVSDAHFGAGSSPEEAEKKQKFYEFLKAVQADAEHLYIIGDLFDFWFEYKSAVFKDHFPVLHHLRNLVDAGVGITYIAGNHDFWLDTFLANEVGIRLSPDPVEADHQGKRIFIAHGDGLIGRDRGYRVLKGVLRFKPNIWLFRLLHPDLGSFLADTVSRFSRNHLSKEKKFDFTDEFRAFARSKFKAGFNAVILGHSHDPGAETIEGHDLLNTGNWITDFSYVVLRDGTFELKYWGK